MKIELITPQFERNDDRIPASAPKSVSDFEALKTKTEAELTELGCCCWCKEQNLWLFPHTWYDAIPANFMVTNIKNEEKPFHPGHTSDDYRYGVLAYGIIRVDAAVSEINESDDRVKRIAIC